MMMIVKSVSWTRSPLWPITLPSTTTPCNPRHQRQNQKHFLNEGRSGLLLLACFCLCPLSWTSSHSAISVRGRKKSMRCCFAHPAAVLCLSLSLSPELTGAIDASKKIHAHLAASFTFFSLGKGGWVCTVDPRQKRRLGGHKCVAPSRKALLPCCLAAAWVRRDRTQSNKAHTRSFFLPAGHLVPMQSTPPSFSSSAHTHTHTPTSGLIGQDHSFGFHCLGDRVATIMFFL